MRIYLDTSQPTAVIKLDERYYEWEAGHDLAKHLLKYIHDKLQESNKDWRDLESITFMSGPGSFTGLRIGATVVNTLASQLGIPLYNHRGEEVDLIMPEYGRPANITPPKK